MGILEVLGDFGGALGILEVLGVFGGALGNLEVLGCFDCFFFRRRFALPCFAGTVSLGSSFPCLFSALPFCGGAEVVLLSFLLCCVQFCVP